MPSRAGRRTRGSTSIRLSRGVGLIEATEVRPASAATASAGRSQSEGPSQATVAGSRTAAGRRPRARLGSYAASIPRRRSVGSSEGSTTGVDSSGTSVLAFAFPALPTAGFATAA